MGQHAENARERVLDAFEDLLVNGGDASATLEGVAAQAGVTKGGLLYHFRSRTALVAGLVERFRDRTADDLASMAAAPEGAARNYLRVADYLSSPLHRTTLALGQLTDRAPEAAAALARAREQEVALIAADVDDAGLAEVITVFAEGLLARTLTTGCVPEPAVVAAFVTRVLGDHPARRSGRPGG